MQLIAFDQVAAKGIKFVFEPPSSILAHEELTISGIMQRAGDVAQVVLFYRTLGQYNFNEVVMELVDIDRYEVAIPKNDIQAPGIEFYIEAKDFLEKSHSVFGSISRPVIIKVQEVSQPLVTDPSVQPSPHAHDNQQQQQQVTKDITPPPKEDNVSNAKPLAKLTLKDSNGYQLDRNWILASGARTVYQLIDMLPGIHVVQNETGEYHIYNQGIDDAAAMAVTINDISVNSFLDGKAWLQIPSALLESIEFVPYPFIGSTSHGMMAGLIKIKLRRLTGKHIVAKINLELNTIDDFSQVQPAPSQTGLYELQAMFGGKHHNLSGTLLTGVTVGKYGFRLVEQDTLSGSSVSATPDIAYQSPLDINIAAIGSYEKNPDSKLEINALYAMSNGRALIGKRDTYSPDSDLLHHQLLFGITYLNKWTDRLQQKIYGNVNYSKIDQNFMLAPKNYSTADRDGDGNAEVFTEGLLDTLIVSEFQLHVGTDVTWQIVDTNRLQFGASAGLEKNLLFSYQRNSDFAGVYRASIGEYDLGPFTEFHATQPHGRLYVLDNWQIHPVVSCNVGLRFDYLGMQTFTTNSMIKHFLSPKFDLIFAIADDMELHFGYEQGFKKQDLLRLYDQEGLITGAYGNEVLQPAVARNAFVRHEFIAPTMVGSLRIETQLYWQWMQDLNYPLYADPQPIYYSVFNGQGPGALLTGLWQFTAGSYMSFYMNWWRRNLSDDAGVISHLPQLTSGIRSHIELHRWLTLALHAKYISQRSSMTRSISEAANKWKLPSTFQVDASLRTALLWEHVRFSLSLINVFATDRRDAAVQPQYLVGMIPRPGLTAIVGVEIQ